MRTPVLSTLLLTTLPLLAQIPNGGFEDWVPLGFYSDPAGWTTNNGYTFPLLGVSHGMPGAVGASFAKVTTHNVNGSVLPGALFAGTPEQPGFPFAQRPISLSGQWQFNMQSGDGGSIVVGLTHWNEGLGVREPVGGGVWFMSGIMPVWQSFTIPITYSSGIDPDTATIQILSSLANGVDGSTAWVDDLHFDLFMGMEDGTRDPLLRLRPCPVTDDLMIDAETALAEVTVLDPCGRVLRRLTAQGPSVVMDVSALPAGTYAAQVRYRDGRTVARRFVKE